MAHVLFFGVCYTLLVVIIICITFVKLWVCVHHRIASHKSYLLLRQKRNPQYTGIQYSVYSIQPAVPWCLTNEDYIKNHSLCHNGKKAQNPRRTLTFWKYREQIKKKTTRWVKVDWNEKQGNGRCTATTQSQMSIGRWKSVKRVLQFRKKKKDILLVRIRTDLEQAKEICDQTEISDEVGRF